MMLTRSGLVTRIGIAWSYSFPFSSVRIKIGENIFGQSLFIFITNPIRFLRYEHGEK